MVPLVEAASPKTEVLLLHAPYPGRLKFDGVPSSLLHAVAPFAHRLAARGRLDTLGWIDPGIPNPDYRAELEARLRNPGLRAVCISTSNAAIEEVAFAVQLARDVAGPRVLVVVGGPHEDDCIEKAATRITGVDLSIAGDAEYALDLVLATFLDQDEAPPEFARRLPTALRDARMRGRFAATSPHWGGESIAFDGGILGPADLAPPVWTTKRVRFPIFSAPETLPVLASRGCPYGMCTFCAEPNRRDARVVREDFSFLRELVAMRPGAALYFQDSIFPRSAAVDSVLLPLLSELGVEWGCQVYLRALSKPWLARLAAHGCTYVYTGLESASPEILAAVGKVNMGPEVALERLRWIRDTGMRVGISLMFGAMDLAGRLLETAATVDATVALADSILATGTRVTGFYPNVLTVLSGTELERGLRRSGCVLDFYRMPRCDVFAGFEDGGVGYNFVSLANAGDFKDRQALALRIVEAGQQLQRSWAA